MKWLFELGGSGYFTIKSVKSGKYLGANSSNGLSIVQYSDISDYTLWKITETTSGNFKFTCKASVLSGKSLSSPSQTSGNGVDLTMLAYVNDTNYRDEWKCISYLGTLSHWYSNVDTVSYWEQTPTIFFQDKVNSCSERNKRFPS